jgi:tetratricopeptide (TPR) repeat protein
VPVIFVTASSEAGEKNEEYSFELPLEPLQRTAHDELVRGFLGKTSLSSLAMGRLFAESGGNPGACHSLLLDLVSRGVLTRSAGIWAENPAGAIQSLHFAPSANPLSVALRLTRGDPLDLLISLGLLRRGASVPDLEGVLHVSDLEGLLYRLSMRGWVRREGDRWLLTSGAVRASVMASAEPGRIAEVANRLRRLSAAALDDTARLEVDLAAGHAEGLVRIAIAVSGSAIKTGNAASAVQWLQGALAAEDALASSGERLEASVMLAEAFLELGEYERAVALTSSAEKAQSAPTRFLVERELALGRALRALGSVSESRQAIERARTLANNENLLDLELASETHLAGIDWELGDEAARAAAIDRVGRLLARTPSRDDLADERAALSYNLGAAMIRAGRYSEARDVLREANNAGPSPYWRMRIGNALSIADYRLGNFDAAVGQIDEVWRIAEEIGADSFRPRILTNKGGYLYGLGRPREAAESNRQGALWAQRFGDSFEYLVGCAGAAICLAVMGRYEEGLGESRATEKTARAIGDTRHVARALEVQAIIHSHLGLLDEAERLLSEARAAYQGHEYVDLGPRLDWLGARLISAKGDRQGAINQLRRIEAALRAAPDLEDLWGVQVELSFLTAEDDPAASLALLAGIAGDARKSSVLVAEVAALACIGEILVEHRIDERDFAKLLTSGLARAEEQGMLEASWQLSYWLGRIALRAGNRKAVQSRFGHAIRVLREISGALTSDHARSYLASPKVSAALREMGAT